MRKKKEDMLITREQILNAAFHCFYENGFERTSLEMIAVSIGMTRGAIYWHFADKKALYRAVVDYTLEQEHGDVAAYARHLLLDTTLQKHLEDVYWFALDNNCYVDFVFKTLNYVSNNAEFDDIKIKLQNAKQQLLQFFDEEIRIYMRLHRIQDKDAEVYSSALFLLFEGMFLAKNIAINIPLNRQKVSAYIGLIISDLISLV